MSEERKLEPERSFEFEYGDVPSIMKEGSYLFYEFEDCTIELPIDKDNPDGDTYTRNISPLFYDKVINNRDMWEFLDMITEEVPFYYMEPDIDIDENDILFQSTRDIGIVNVPSPLQENDFYQVWFRDSMGYIKNLMVLDFYNKLRYPYILENQYMNAKLFPRMANNLISEILKNSGPEYAEARIGFKTTEEENAEVYDPNYKYYGHEIGCLDYMNKIVSEKVDSNYSLIDFNPEQAGFLSSWVESLYQSGVVGKSESEEERLIFKLQDIKSELLRRKFAGSYTLYMIMLASIGRTGSYLGVINAGNAKVNNIGTSEDYVNSHNDERPIRIPNLPGIFTDIEGLNEVSINPIDIYYNKPDESKKIPLRTLIPLFYSSGSTKSTIDYQYHTEAFYKAIQEDITPGYVNPEDSYDYRTVTGATSSDYRNAFYRDTTNRILWDNMSGVLSQESLLEFYDTLDMMVLSDDGKTYRYRTLDEFIPGTDSDNKEYYTLDSRDSLVDLSSIYGSVLDITANHILYHRNILQKTDDHYDYVTYPIASNNSLSLMDTPWLDYVEYHSSKKSKVNEDVTFGAQISTFIEVEDSLGVPHEFFTYEYKKENENDASSPEWVYIYFCILKYNAESFKIQKYSEKEDVLIKKTLITKIRLKHDGDETFYEDYPNRILKSEYKEFEKFTKYNVGLLPLTFNQIKNDDVEYLKMGAYGTTWYDDALQEGLADAYFIFSDYDTTRNYDKINIDPVSLDNLDSSPKVYKNEYLSSDDIKEIRYVVKRIERQDSKMVSSFYWSDPIRVFPYKQIENEITEGEDFEPDWRGMGYHLNPYLNFTPQSASTLRYKKVIGDINWNSNGTKTSYIEGPSDITGLSNLARSRHMDYVCNDYPDAPSTLGEYWSSYKGMYLKKEQEEYKEYSIVDIYGDNRYQDEYDFYYNNVVIGPNDRDNPFPIPGDVNTLYIQRRPTTGEGDKYFRYEVAQGYVEIFNIKLNKFRSNIYQENFLRVPSIHIEKNEEIPESFSLGKNILKLEPTNDSDLDNWYWNQDSDGMTICMNLIFNDVKGTIVLAERENEFSLECANGEIKFTVGSKSVISTETIVVQKNYRISASVKDGEAILIVNNEISKKSGATYTKASVKSAPITLFSTKSCTNNFLGEILDVRLYNEGRSEANLYILNAGLFREIYSYAPSTYKLAHSVYEDFGFVRVVDNTSDNPTEYGIKKIGSIRVLNRSVWDSIMVDVYPVSLEECTEGNPQYYEYNRNPLDDRDVYIERDGKYYLNDCIEQTLLENLESFNGRSVQANTELVYNNTYHTLKKSSYITAVLSLIQPIDYKESSMDSSSSISLSDTNGLNSIGSIPVDLRPDASDDYFKYSADLYPNFRVTTETSLSRFLTRGTNIALKYYEDADDSLIVLKDSTIKESGKNYVVTALYIPEQIDSSNTTTYLDRLNVKNFVFGQTFTDLLRATSYYTEIRIPVPCDRKAPGYSPALPDSSTQTLQEWSTYHSAIKGPGDGYLYVIGDEGYEPILTDDSPTETKKLKVSEGRYYYYDNDKTEKAFYNKWDAIRTLKEGVYVFTCKYPVKILPFSDEDFSLLKKDAINTVYGTMRFKIEVKGTPKEITEEEERKYDIDVSDRVPEEFRSDKIEATLKKASSRISPDDNKTFPHRKMSIKLYAYDIESGIAGIMNGDTEDYEYEWNLIASNNIEDCFEDSYIPAESFSESETYYTKTTSSDKDVYKKVEKSDENYLDNYYIKESTPTNIAYLSDDNLDKGLLIKENVPMFLSKNYEEAFYVNEYDRSKPEELSADSTDDDLIDPIIIYPNNYYDSNEHLVNSSESDIDHISLVGGRAYKILFDYTSNTTEVSYFGDTDDEKLDTKEAVANIKSTISNPDLSSFIYTKDGESLDKTPGAMSDSMGYHFNGQTWDKGRFSDTVREWECLGNPYSNVAIENTLSINGANVINSYQIKYLDMDRDVLLSVYPIRYDEHRRYPSYDSGFGIIHKDFTEADILKFHYDSIDPKSFHTNLIQSAYGIIGGFSTITPNILNKEIIHSESGTHKESSISAGNDVIHISNDEYELYSYQVPSWNIPMKNTISIYRTGVFEKLLENGDFNRADLWEIKKKSSNMKLFKVSKNYLPTRDDTVDIKIYPGTVTGGGVPNLSIKYKGSDSRTVESRYKASLVLYIPDGITVSMYNNSSPTGEDDPPINADIKAKLYNGDKEVGTFDLTLKDWKVVEGEVDGDKKSYKVTLEGLSDPVIATTIEFLFRVCRESDTELEVDTYRDFLSLGKATIYVQQAHKYNIGLSDIYYKGTTFDPDMIVASHTVPVFKNKNTNVLIPIQFKNGVVKAQGITRPEPGVNRCAAFISKCAIETQDKTSRIRKLTAPWVRRIYVYNRGESDAEILFHKYSVKKDSLNVNSYKEIYSDVTDIYKVEDANTAVSIVPDKEKESFIMTFTGGIKINLDDDGTISYYKNNLIVDTMANGGAISLENEKFSYTYNCFDLNRYRQGLSSPVAITNVQLLNRDLMNTEGSYDNREVVYEIEYLPIIYDELKNHISFNIMMYHELGNISQSSGEDEGEEGESPSNTN